MLKVVIPKPCIEEVQKYLDKMQADNNLEHYREQGKAIKKLFKELPENKELADVLIKAAVLNDFYSTNIFNVYAVARNILNISNCDERLNQGDHTLIDEIKKVQIGETEKNFYSFATKYCSHHNPAKFPIYDSYVDKALYYFNKHHSFSSLTFKKEDLKTYEVFYLVLQEFQRAFGLDDFSLREIDTYLWLLGKEYFQKEKNKE